MSPFLALLLVCASLTSLSFVTSNDDVSLESLLTTLQQQAALIQQQAATINSMQSQQASMQATLQHHTSDIAQANTNIAGVTTKVNDVTTRLNTRVSFTAQMSHGTVTITDSPFLFDSVVNNVGNGYNPQSGVFTAPVAGDYIFSAQVLNQPNTDRVDWAIFKAGSQILCANHLTQNVPFYNTASCFATTHLQKGDTVFVKHINAGVAIEGGIWTSFSGQLVNADP